MRSRQSMKKYIVDDYFMKGGVNKNAQRDILEDENDVIRE